LNVIGRTGARTHGGAERARTIYFVAAAVLAALVPLILFAGLWIHTVLNQNERDLQAYLLSQASLLSGEIDAEIQQQLSILRAVASVPSLDEPNLENFQEVAARMVSAIPQWSTLGLVDATTGRPILDTLRPLGSELPAFGDPDVIRRVVEVRAPAVRVRHAGDDNGFTENTVLLYMPVIRNDAVRSVLIAAVKAQLVQRHLRDDPKGTLAVLLDESGRVLARSHGLEGFLGRELNAELREAATSQLSGLVQARTLDDQPVYTGFQRSMLTGWLAVAATDDQQVDAITEQSTWTLIGTGALSLTLAAILAVFLFYNFVQRRVSDERLAASRALGELDARLLATMQEALAEQRKSASEREVLLREIYHRVKNNLQIIQSLLRLGSRNLKPDQREPFESAIRRIGAMARVHTLLYNSPDLASIDFKDYLEEVIRETADAFGADMRDIRTKLDAHSMRVPLDTAVPLAFITVEILTNAFKHAFPGQRGGVISVSARQEGEHGVLVIADNGIGLQGDAVGGRPLGLTLVNKLIEQIGGTLDRPRPGESTYRVTFPLVPAHQPTVFPPASS
jgi:two-component sensor histidine kinase